MATSALKLRAMRHSLLYKRAPEQPSYVLSDCLLVTQKTIVNHDYTNNRKTTNSSPEFSENRKENDACKLNINISNSPKKHAQYYNNFIRDKRAIKENPNGHIQTAIQVSPSKQLPRKDNQNNDNSQLSCPVINVQIKRKPVESEENPQLQTQRTLQTTPRAQHFPKDQNESSVYSDQDGNNNISTELCSLRTKTSKGKSASKQGLLSKTTSKGRHDKDSSLMRDTHFSKTKNDGKAANSMIQNSKIGNNIISKTMPDSSISDVYNIKGSVWKQDESESKTDGLWEIPIHRVKAHRGRREIKRSKTSTGYYQDRTESLPVRATKSARPQRCPTAPPNPIEQPQLTNTDCRTICLKLEEYLYNDNLPKFQEYLLPYTPKDKKRLIDFKDDKTTSNIFFRACGLAKIPFVQFLLDHCNPDLELKGPFFLFDDHTQYLVTPLWQAAASGRLFLVRILNENGADINASSDTGSSPLAAACYMSHVDVVTYLLSNKAMVNTCNDKGLTCLMNAVQNVDLVRLLVLNGADINRPDHRGNTSMHFAVEEGRVKTVKILFELGGNPLLVNKDGFNAIQSAAKYRHRDVVDYLLHVSKLKVVDIINVYEMIGAMVIMMDDDLDEGFAYLHKATTLRYLNKSQVIMKKLSPSLLSDHEKEIEFTNVQQLTKIARDPAKFRIQALMIYERQWGSSHDNFLQLLLYCGATFADYLNFKEAGNLWRLSYQLHFQKYVCRSDICSDPFNQNVLKSLGFVMKLLFQWRRVLNSRNVIERNDDNFMGESENNSIENKYYISEINVRRALCLLCQHCVIAQKWLKDQAALVRNKYKEAFYLLLRSAICVLLVYVESFSREERGDDIWPYVQHLISLNPRGEHNETILHMCLRPQTLSKLELDISDTPITWPSVTMINITLILGANPTDSNQEGNTALHLAAMLQKQGILSEGDRIIQSLLSKGAHADQVNRFGQTAYNLLDSKDVSRYNNPWQSSISLKCLSARVITNYGIEYIGEVPVSLYSFIELHRSVHS